MSKKRGRGDVTILQQKKEGKTNKLEKDYKKVTWWLLPIFTHRSMGEKPDYTGLGSIKTHHFPQVEAVHTRVLRSLILKKKSFHRDGKITIGCLSLGEHSLS